MRRRRLLLIREVRDDIDESLICFAIVFAETRNNGAEVSAVELRRGIDLSVRKPLPRGLNGTKPMPSSSSVGMTDSFGITPEEGVFALQGCDALYGMSAANGLCACFGETEMLYLACPDQILNGTSRFLNGRAGLAPYRVVMSLQFYGRRDAAPLADRQQLLVAVVQQPRADARLLIRADKVNGPVGRRYVDHDTMHDVIVRGL